MITSIYAGVLALLIVWLSLNVIKLRRAKKSILVMAAKQNSNMRSGRKAIQYISISLILLMLLEMSQLHVVLVHMGGLALVMGRYVHAYGLLSQTLRYRILGMQITFFTITELAAINICYDIYTLYLRS
jgi:uncharacterized membrane protein YecN with MAPEG domain